MMGTAAAIMAPDEPVERIALSVPDIGEHERRFVDEAFAGNWIDPLGPNLDAFERELAARVGAGKALAVSSGTDGLHLARGVEERRGGLGPVGITPFPLPAHQTGRADFPHPASRPASPQSTRRWAKMDPTSSDHTELPERDRIGETPGASRRHLVAGSAFALT